MDILDHRISGIPCQIEVTEFFRHYIPYAALREDADFDEGVSYEIDYQVLDRKGYKADWLENKVTSAEHDKIIDKIIDSHLNSCLC